MANWSSLQPLRVHVRFMTVVVLALIGVLVLTPRHAFRAQAIVENSERNQSISRVNALSGLSIRDQPTIHSTILTTAPYHASLTVIDENAAEDLINGKSGTWVKVEYQGTTGFAWGTYIDQ